MDKLRMVFFTLVCLLGLAFLPFNLGAGTTVQDEEDDENTTRIIDDWMFDPNKLMETIAPGSQGAGAKLKSNLINKYNVRNAANIAIGKGNTANMGSVNLHASPAPQALGFAVGGSKDTGSFTQNLDNGYLPKYDSITYEGLFYDYYFDTGVGTGRCKDLFCPSYAKAVTRDVYSGEPNYYLSVGLNSGLTEESFARKRLNLVVVVDISGSMGGSFNAYYYNGTTQLPGNNEKETPPKSKMQLANEAIVAMMDHLAEDDRFGVVLFDSTAYRAKPLRLVKATDMKAIGRHIMELRQQGGTNWQAGYEEGVSLFTSLKSNLKDPLTYENRIIFLTDAMPNLGELDKGGLFDMVRNAAEKNIHTSFIGVGVDFNPELVEHVTKTRGANYFSVHSAPEFKKRLADEFDYMVTPLVFDLELSVTSKDYTIDGVFGSPEADLATGEVMKINTLFPSPTEDEQVKGGVVLVKLKKSGAGTAPIELTVRYKDRGGKSYKTTDTARFTAKGYGYDNNGIRKAVLLTEHVSLIKNWLLDTRKGCNDQVEHAPVIPLPFVRCGIINPETRPLISKLPTWEKKSCPLEVSEGYRKLFSLFYNHFEKEMQEIGDTTLKKELSVLEQLLGTSGENTKDDPSKPVDDWQING